MNLADVSDFEVQETGDVKIEAPVTIKIAKTPEEAVNTPEKPEKKPKRETKLDLILDKINDANYDPAEVSRMIAVEIATVAREMTNADETTFGEALKLKGYSEQVKALRELGKQLTDADILSKKDVLNFDGPKFQWVLGVIVDLFVKSMKEAGVQEDMRASIMKHYRDLMGTQENTIRREVQKIDSNVKSK